MKKTLACVCGLVLSLCLVHGLAAQLDDPIPDISTLSFDDLVALQERLSQEFTERSEWESVTVPLGVWKVGVDIPAGHWTVTAAPGVTSHVIVCDAIDETGTKPVVTYNGYYFAEMLRSKSYRGFRADQDTDSFDINVSDGMYFFISTGSVVFTPYMGKPLLSFSLNSPEVKESHDSGLDSYTVQPGVYVIGESIPAGEYEVYVRGGGSPCVISSSISLNANGKPDQSSPFYFSVRLDRPGAEHQMARFYLCFSKYDYLMVEGQTCTFYLEKAY